MSDRPIDTSTDWRRQRRRGRGRGPGGAATPERGEPDTARGAAVEPQTEAAPGDSDEQIIASRTLFSFLEPVLDTIGLYGAPVVIAGIVGLITGIVLVAFVGSMRLYGLIALAFGSSLLVLMILIYMSSVFAAFLSRTGRYGVNSLVMLGAFLGIIIIINFISFGNNSRMDVTATQQFSLANSTRDLLRELDQPIKAIAFYPDDFTNPQEDRIVRRAKVEDTLSEFENRSNRFTYEFRDPDLYPEIARNYGVTSYESIVIEGQESGIVDIVQPTDQVYSELEQDLYTGILVASGQELKRVYFLAGHGERSISSSTGDGYSTIRNGLEGDNYQVASLRWNPGDADVSVPDDAALLVIAGPSGELPEAHAQALDAYLKGRKVDGTERREGGRVIFLAEQGIHESFREFMASWGIVVDRGYIRDLDNSVPGSPQTLRQAPINISQLPRELLAGVPPEILQPLQGITEPKGSPLGVIFMPGASPVNVVNDQLRVPVPLAFTSPNSYVINDPERIEPITEGEQADPRGPFRTAVYVRAFGPVGAPPPTSQPPDPEIPGMIIFGDSDFVSNSFVDRGSGAALFLNSANYLLGDYSLVSIRDRQFVFREFNLDQNQFNFVRFSSWFFLPGLMALMAALVWWVRR